MFSYNHCRIAIKYYMRYSHISIRSSSFGSSKELAQNIINHISSGEISTFARLLRAINEESTPVKKRHYFEQLIGILFI